MQTDREFKETIDEIASDQAIILRVISINQNRRPSVRYVSFRKP